MSAQLIWPHVFAAGAAILAAVVFLYGLWQRFRWGRAVAELREVSQGLETPYGLRGHRELHHSFDDIIRTLLELSKRRPAARWVLDELRPVVAQYHRRAVVGSAGAWDEIRNAFLERKRHPVRLTRAAAGWVVLLGLAGTVLGFMEALPALREVLASQAEETEPASPPIVETAPEAVNGAAGAERSDAAEQTGKKLNRVLDSLRGVFLATLWGVISAVFLSTCNLLLLEPAFDRFADDVDVLGARWFEPLIQPPDTLIDDALRGELRFYFEEIGKRLETVLNPLISQLRVSLEQMSGLASDFSSNIRMGVGTLQTFHGAVEKLGGSAQGAVDQLVQIVRTSEDFVKQVESLQEKGLAKLAEALSSPTRVLANSAIAINERVQALEGQISALGEASKAIASAIGEHSQGEAALREDISTNIDVLRHQIQAISHLRASVDSTAKNLRAELSPLFTDLSQNLIEAQTRAAQESRATSEKVAVGVDSVRGMLVSLQALASPERIHEERRVIDGLSKAVENLSRNLGQQAASQQPPQSESEQKIRHLEAEIRSMRRQVEGGAEGRAPMPPPASIPRPVRPEPSEPTGFWRWLGFGRAPKGPALNEIRDGRVSERKPMEYEKPRSEAEAHNPLPKPAPLDSYQTSQSQVSSVDLQTLDRAVSRLLENESGSWKIERFLESLKLTLGSNVSFEVQHLVPRSDGEWRLVAFWPQRSQEGLALVSSGELADANITRYFDTDFGRRITRCRKPALVSRSGEEVTVLRKGKVESS